MSLLQIRAACISSAKINLAAKTEKQRVSHVSAMFSAIAIKIAQWKVLIVPARNSICTLRALLD